jgi:hypothetical protein
MGNTFLVSFRSAFGIYILGEKEYVRVEYPITGEPAKTITTNMVEGYYSVFKRGMKGVYQHCKGPHLQASVAFGHIER